MSSRRRILIACAVVASATLAAVLVLWMRPSAPRLGRTNVVLVIIDTLRADRLGCYGYPRNTSPNIDRIAAESVVFETVVANCSWTRPSVASLLTGTLPRQTGVFKERFDVLAPEVVTLAEMFSNQGYATLGVTANPTINSDFGFDRGFDEYGDCGVMWRWMDRANQRPRAGGRLLTEDADMVTDRALALVERVGEGPFYLQVLYIDPHLPYDPPAGFEHEVGVGTGTPSERYDAEVAFVDSQVGRLLDTLLGQYPDTLVVMTSDHGEGLGDHPRVARAATHGYTLYDSVLLVPLVIHHPDLAAGVRFPGMVQLMDIVPTVADLLGLAVDRQVRGTSLAAIVRGLEAPPLPARAFSETQYKGVDKISVREERVKLILNRDHVVWAGGGRPDLDAGGSVARAIRQCGPRELYRIPGREDPISLGVDRVRREPHTVRLLEQAIVDFVAAEPPRPPLGRDRTAEIDDSIIAQLEALGYLDGDLEESGDAMRADDESGPNASDRSGSSSRE